MQSRFGCGFLFGIPTGGTTPVMFSALQDVSVDFSQDVKYLYGSQRFPIEQAGGKAKIEGKAAVGRIDPVLFNNIYWNGTLTSGAINIASIAEAGVIPSPSGPYTITVANSANWRVNLAVYNTVTQLFMTQVPSAPTTGQYSVAAGVYTFAAADAGIAVQIYYTYQQASGGVKIVGTNDQLGTISSFKAVLQTAYAGKQSVLTLNRCISTKFSMPFKQDDFLIPSFNFSAQDDGTGQVFTFDHQN